MGEGGKDCVPQDTIAPKDEAYSEPNSPTHEGAHSSREKFSNNCYHIATARGEMINIEHTSLGAGERRSLETSSVWQGADGLTFLPDRWLPTMFHGRRHSVLFDLNR